MKKDEQIRDLSKILVFKNEKETLKIAFDFKILERDISTLQSKLKESKKVTMREPTPTPTIVVQTQSRLAQTDPWMPSPVSEKPDDSNKELQTMMQNKVEALEHKYQTIIEQKNAQIQQLMQEVYI